MWVVCLQVVEKQRATLEFEVNEDDVEGRWMRSDVEIQFSVEKRFTYTTIRKLHRLTISETFRSDAGEYTFLAGKNRSTMNLHIRRERHLHSFFCGTVQLVAQNLMLKHKIDSVTFRKEGGAVSPGCDPSPGRH